MDWSNERYVRLYTRDTTTWKLLDWRARCTLTLLIRKVDRSGVLDVGEDGIEGLAAVVELPVEVVGPGIEQLVRRGTVEHNGNAYVLPNFIEAQEAPMSDAARKRDSREKRRDRSRSAVTNRDRVSQNVTETSQNRTNGHTRSQTVTDSHSDPIRSDPILAEPSVPARAILPSTVHSTSTVHEDPELLERRRLKAETEQRVQELRERVAAQIGLVGVRPLPLQGRGERALASRISESGSIARAREDIAHVLVVAEAEALSKATVEYLSLAMFEDVSWQKKLAMTVDDATRSRAGPGKPPPQPPRPMKTL